MALRDRSLAPVGGNCRPPIPLPCTLDEMLTFAELVMASGLTLGHTTKESVVIALQLGAELGFTPMQSLRTIAVIDGWPVPSADACVAAVTASDQCDYFREVETTDLHSTWETKRRGDVQPRQYTFTMDDARRARLTAGDTWRAYPKRMLAARAKKYLAQDTYPDVIGGLLSTEEALDLAETPAPTSDGAVAAAEETPCVRITSAQVDVLRALIAEGGAAAEPQCLEWLRGRLPDVHALSDLPAAEYTRVKKAVEDRNTKRQALRGESHATAD